MSGELQKILERLERIERRLEALHEDVRRNGEEISRANLRKRSSDADNSSDKRS